MSAYQIADEPAPSSLARLVVNPVFPLLGVMLGGVWLAWPWFALNAIAVGSPTRRAELAWLGLGLVAIAALSLTIVTLFDAGVLPRAWLPYAILVVVVAKLAVVYVVYSLQSRTIEIYEHYGGVLRSGVWVVAAGFFFRGRVIDALPGLAQLVLS